jgi:ribonucleoside-diphosphate reductase beta chain
MLAWDDKPTGTSVPLQRASFCRRGSRANPDRRRPLEEAPELRRVNAADKRIINGADRRQPAGALQVQVGLGEVPGRTCANHWMPQEVNMSRDIALWKDPNGLTEDERRIVKRNLGFFVTADSLAANNIVLGTYRHITGARVPPVPAAPGLRGGDPHPRLPVHRRSLGLDEGEIFNAYHEVRRSATRTSS